MTPADQASGKAEDREGSRAERRKARTATAIRDAGERLFISRGYSATTMEDLAEEADVAVGSIYAHFASKEGVYGALIERALELDKQYCDEGFYAGDLPLNGCSAWPRATCASRASIRATSSCFASRHRIAPERSSHRRRAPGWRSASRMRPSAWRARSKK